MLPANAAGVGQHVSPVVIATPVGAPTPAVNMGPHATAVPFCPTILLTAQPALNLASTVPAGPNIPPLVPPVLPSVNLVGIPKILVMGLPATALTTPVMAGGPVPGATAIPDVTNVLYMYAGATRTETESGQPATTLEDLRAIAQSLTGGMVESSLLAGGVGYVSIRRFAFGVPTSVFHAVRTLAGRGMESLVVDLRGNLGGEVDAAVQLAGDFLEPGALIATSTDADGDSIEYRARTANAYAFPLVLLVDACTASAAELFAGCLGAHRRAVVVGPRTYGKGEAKAVVAGPGGAPVYGTAATFRLPGGGSVQGTGVATDLRWPSGDVAAWRAEADRCLSGALRDAIESLALGFQRT
jgi:carboxyl-terminal processing protease